jgi:Ca2+-binding RTX toxin-like protein
LAGGPGNNIFRFNTRDVDTGETVTLSGTTDSFEVITTTEFNLMNTGGSITGLDAIRISAGQSAVFLSNQLTGLTLTVDGVAGGASETLVVNASTNLGVTINLSGASLTNVISSITGGNGGDTITGTNADDIITTGLGTDIINAGGGNNQITGAGWTNGGYEQITHNTAGATVTIGVTGSNGVRLIASELGASVIAADGGLRSIFADFSTASVTLNASALSQSSYNAVLEGGSANDTITGGAGADVITGGGGADNITAGAGVDRLIYNAVVEVSSDSNAATTDTVADLAATDFVILNLTNVNNFEVASDVMGHNTTAGKYTADTNGNATYTDIGDVVFNTTSLITDTQARALTILNATGTNGNDTISGGANADTIDGGDGADIITGGAGDDVLTGGAGADVLTGGNGTDLFVYALGATGITLGTADTITDFTSAQDFIRIYGNYSQSDIRIMDGTNLVSFANFVGNVDSWFGGIEDVASVYVAWNAAGTGNAWVAIDNTMGGYFTPGDSLIILSNVNSASKITVSNFC